MEGERGTLSPRDNTASWRARSSQNGKLERAGSVRLAALEHEEVDVPEAQRSRLEVAASESHPSRSRQVSERARTADQALRAVLGKGRSERRRRSAGGLPSRPRPARAWAVISEAVEASSSMRTGSMAEVHPASEPAATIAYWYGQALIANGEAARGQAFIAGASPQLAASRVSREIARS